jgi:hypothetical protein
MADGGVDLILASRDPNSRRADDVVGLVGPATIARLRWDDDEPARGRSTEADTGSVISRFGANAGKIFGCPFPTRRSVRPLVGMRGHTFIDHRCRRGGIEGACVILPECETHEHADCRRKRYRKKETNETEQMTERE